MYFILSPCGTSLLTNQAKGEERSLIFKYANVKLREEIPSEDRKRLDEIIDRVKALLLAGDKPETGNASLEKVAKLSAELNGILKFYGGQIPDRNDVHFLLSTDTYLGSTTAELVKQWLESQNRKFIFHVHRQVDLRTVDVIAFQLALSDLVKTFSQVIPDYSRSGYRIIFNLTGGFKSIQGFLQSIANFYADESIYIFETASDLLRIPKLPVRLDALGVIRAHLTTFRRLALDLNVNKEETKQIPQTLLLPLDDQVTLSPWGSLIWEEAKKEIYGETILASPEPHKLEYGKRFLKSVQALPPDRKVIINERIDQLVRHLMDRTYNPPSLDFKPIKGQTNEIYEMDAWADLDAKRLFGHFEGEKFVLDKLDKGLH